MLSTIHHLSRTNPNKITLNTRFNILCLLAALLSLAACQPESNSTRALEPANAQTYFPIKVGGKQLQLQLALNSSEQQRGLMFRDSLDLDHGMLFLFPKPEKRGFWMKNTRIPLDIGYFDTTGRLLDVHKLYPHDERPVPSATDTVLIAIETDRGWYAKNQITPGAQIDLEDLRAALKRRNHSNTYISK